MFLIPLGLQARIHDLPLVTLLLVTLTVVYSTLNMDLTHSYLKEYLNSPTVQKADWHQRQLATAYCKKRLDPTDCSVLYEFSKTDKPANLISVHTELRKVIVAKFGPKTSALASERILNYLDDDKLWSNPPAEVQNLPNYGEFSLAQENKAKEVSLLHSKFDLLSILNMNELALLKAQFLHDGWLHLIGNMLFLILFGFAVEQRIGAVFFAAIYFIGGTVGLGLQILLLDKFTFLLGASANVFAIGGAFLALFWKLNMRVWFSWMFMVNRVVLMRTWVFFTFFVFLQEFTGVLQTQSRVAHWAHLIGATSGLLLALAVKRLKPVSEPFVYQYEERLFRQAFETESPNKRMRIASHLIRINPFNDKAYNLLFLNVRPGHELRRALPTESIRMVRSQLALLLQKFGRQKQWDEFSRYYLRATNAELGKGLAPLIPMAFLIKAAQHLVRAGLNTEALVLYNSALELAPPRVKAKLSEEINQLTGDPQHVQIA